MSKGTNVSGRPNELRWLLQQLWPQRRLAAGSLALLGVTILLAAADPLLLKWLIDSGLRRHDHQTIAAALAMLLVVYSARLWIGYLGGLVGFTLNARMVTSLRARLYGRLQSRDLSFVEQHAPGDLARTIEDDVDQAARAGVDLMPALLRMVLTAGVTVVILAALNWRLTLLAVPVVPLLLLVRARFRGPLESLADGARNAFGERSSVLATGLVNHAEIVAVGAERFFRRQFLHYAVRATRASLRQRRSELRYSIGSAALIGAATLLMLWTGTVEVEAGRLTIGGYIAFYSYLSRLFEPALASTELYASLKRAGSPIRRLIELARSDGARIAGSGSGSGPLPMRDWDAVSFEEVSASYREGRPILKDATFSIHRGDFVALTGESGSGKSMIVQVLLRLRAISGGRYYIGSRDTVDFPAQSIRKSIAYVPARPFIIHGTLRENVCLGASDVTDAQLRAAAYTACFDTVVAGYPDGWNHELTPNGSGLSDGERQRLGITRALLTDRPLLVVDEGTGAIDERMEGSIIERLRERRRGQMTLVVTHRPSVAVAADYVLTLCDGRLSRSDGRPAVRAETLQESEHAHTGTHAPLTAREPLACAGIAFSQG